LSTDGVRDTVAKKMPTDAVRGGKRNGKLLVNRL